MAAKTTADLPSEHHEQNPLIVIRVKRKRSDVPVEELVVTENVLERPRKRVNLGKLASRLSSLSTSADASMESDSSKTDATRKRRRQGADEHVYYFTRITGPLQDSETSKEAPGSDTADQASKNQLVASGVANTLETTKSSCGELRLLKRRRTKVSIIDIIPEGSSKENAEKVSSSKGVATSSSSSSSFDSGDNVGPIGPAPPPTAILTPFEEIMDRAIYNAFMDGPSRCAGLISAIVKGGPVNFQRKLAANTTALMAAAHWKRTDIVKRLLEQGAIKSLCDSHGRTALDFAIQQGHGPTIKILSEDTEEASTNNIDTHKATKNTTGGDDDVYDYFIMTKASSHDGFQSDTHQQNVSQNGTKTTSRSARATINSYHVPLLRDSHMHIEKADDDDESDGEYGGSHLQWGLTGQLGEEYAEEALDDENHEGYVGNEYPDEELLTSDDGLMISEDSSQEDEDFW